MEHSRKRPRASFRRFSHGPQKKADRLGATTYLSSAPFQSARLSNIRNSKGGAEQMKTDIEIAQESTMLPITGNRQPSWASGKTP